MAVTQVGTPATPGLTITGTSGTAVATGGGTGGTATTWSGTQPLTKGDLVICVITGYSTTSCAATAQNTGTTGWTKLVEVLTQAHTITAIWGKVITAATGTEPVPVFTSVLTGTASHMRLTTWLKELAGADWDLGNILTASASAAATAAITATTGSNVLSSGWYALSGFCEGYTSTSTTITYTKGASWAVATGVSPNTFTTSTYAHSACDQYSSPPSGSTLAEIMTISTGTVTSTSGAFIVVPPAPETSPSLELYGFAISGPGSSDTINSVTVAITEYQSSLSSDPCTFELWDYCGTPAIIGTTQTGTSSTSSSNISSAVFTGVSYSQLATLRVRVYGNARPGSSYVESVDGVSIVVNYSPSPNATVTMGSALAVSSSIPQASVGYHPFPATVAITSSIPAPAVNVFTSPYLELSGFGTFTGVTSSAAINSVTLAITQYQSVSSMPANTFELWDYSGTPAIIGSTQTGTASTSSSNVDTAVYSSGITYGMLATLRVRVYAHSGNTASGTAYVDARASPSTTRRHLMPRSRWPARWRPPRPSPRPR